MKHLIDAMRRPFTDFNKLLIGIIISIIPIVNFISIGYQFRCAKTAMTGKFAMPKWKILVTYLLREYLVA